MNHRQVFTVAQVNRYVKKILESDALLTGLFIEGELSNFNAHASGHLYFTLKDPAAAISSVMFKGHASELAFTPKSGMKVIAFGRLSMYEKSGQYQLYVEYLEPAGVGGLQLAFNQLREKLEGEGLFDPEKKRPLPQFAKCVAVITSPTGAAVQDIIRIIRGRNHAVKVVVSPALVQGEGAAADLARALKEVNAWGKADVIIIGRGGGSIEDLWAFNDEVLARAIAGSKIPVISAVGHETDFTIADFVADTRAPTPTAAAQMAVYDQRQVMYYVQDLQDALSRNLKNSMKKRFDNAKALTAQLSRQTDIRLSGEWQRLSHQEALLEKVSPYAAFKRGYALVRAENGSAVLSAKTLNTGDTLTLYWADGEANVKIDEVNYKDA
ncbi:MAG: exodeoxyribonuclease VII large subunit [Defluviitaleaceae bacterium]|nr:exodeoxyribonuclease VII large subunit [Defluviitaleaceae bacterium]